MTTVKNPQAMLEQIHTSPNVYKSFIVALKLSFLKLLCKRSSNSNSVVNFQSLHWVENIISFTDKQYRNPKVNTMDPRRLPPLRTDPSRLDGRRPTNPGFQYGYGSSSRPRDQNIWLPDCVEPRLEWHRNNTRPHPQWGPGPRW